MKHEIDAGFTAEGSYRRNFKVLRIEIQLFGGVVAQRGVYPSYVFISRIYINRAYDNWKHKSFDARQVIHVRNNHN